MGVRSSVFSNRNIHKKFPVYTAILNATMHKWLNLSNSKVILALLALVCLQQIEKTSAESTDVQEGRTSTLQLSGSDSNTYLYSALLIVPVLAVIVLLDFAIFGTFARRADELNPVSHFFYHVRRGLHISQAKYRRQYGGVYNRYRGNRHRYSRSLLQQAGPLLSQLSATRQKYEEEE